VRVVDPGDPRWVRLRAIIEERSLLRGDFTLTSGRKSTYLFQLRQTTMLPEGQHLIGTLIEEFMRRVGVRSIGGLVVGAVPVVSAAAYASHLSGHPVDAFFVRKDPKPHGARELIDGTVADGANVLVVDDVTTSGGSIVKAIDNIRLEKPACTFEWALSVVDRDQGACEALAARNVRFAAIFTKYDFGIA